jgi:hypothetical protein
VGLQIGNVDSLSFDKDAWLPDGCLGANVAGARDGSWSRLCFIWFCFAGMPSHVGVDVNGLACFLHQRMVCDWQTWVQCSLISVVLSCCVAVVGDTFLGGARPPETEYLPWSCPSGYLRDRILRGEAHFC